MALKPPVEVPQGAIRLNTDSQKLEFFAQDQWWQMATDVPNLARSADSGVGPRGVFAGGYAYGPGNQTNVIDYVNIASAANAVDFGDLTEARGTSQGFASRTRGVYCHGKLVAPGSNSNTLDYITIATTGNAADFGDSDKGAGHGVAAFSNRTRGVIGGGNGNPSGPCWQSIDYVTIATTGNTKDFGDLTIPKYAFGGTANTVRGIFTGGDLGPAPTNTVDFVTIATTGNALDFGDQQISDNGQTACSNSTIALLRGGGHTPGTWIEMLTIATRGNCVEFGNGIAANASPAPTRRRFVSSCASGTRGLFAGGYGYPGSYPTVRTNQIEYVTISTRGDAIDFGDLTVQNAQHGGLSNAHGGL